MAFVKREPLVNLIARMHPDIERTARNQRIPGMKADEVAAEMYVCLWKAQQSYRRSMGTTIEQYWWAIWMNRKADLLAYYFAQKRAWNRETLIDPHRLWTADEAEELEQLHPLITIEEVLVPRPPESSDPLAERVWNLLADGYTRKDVLSICEITRRRFYNIIESFREEGDL